jgi:AraC-like DNA-binding protein
LAPRSESYLPLSDNVLLGPVLKALQADPGDRQSLAEWARRMKTTERTLSRRCHDDLGISFNEWRQRLKLVAALALIEAGQPVQRIATQLG